MIEYTMHLTPRIKTIKSKNDRIELHYHLKEVKLFISDNKIKSQKLILYNHKKKLPYLLLVGRQK